VIEQPAYVEAYEETQGFARVSGYVQKVHVDLGDRVKGPCPGHRVLAELRPFTSPEVDAASLAAASALSPLGMTPALVLFDDPDGQVLAELLVPEMAAELKQKGAQIVQARSEAEQARAAFQAAVAHVETASAMVREAEAGTKRADALVKYRDSQYKRMEQMVKSKTLGLEEREEALHQLRAAEAGKAEALARVKSAEAGLIESEAKRAKAFADVRAAQAREQVAQADYRRMYELLQYTKIRAPFNGVVAKRDVNTGDYLTGAGTKPLFVIARTDTVRIVVQVPETEAMYVSDGTPARIRCQIIKDQEFEGKVTRTSWLFDDRARTLRAEIHLYNPEGKLRPGMYAYVTFFAELQGSYTLPAAAVVTHGGDPCVFCVENNKAVRTPVKVGARDSQLVQVLKKRNGPAKAGEPGVWESFTGREEVILTNPGSLLDRQTVVVERKK
jgi:multidrug resistance efflux pump